ncbi:MAG: alpha/beta fold hydrolase [Myxococcales bacterium]|nr:alpha/beta fold hydrolase [Myxococcales bacterium]
MKLVSLRSRHPEIAAVDLGETVSLEREVLRLGAAGPVVDVAWPQAAAPRRPVVLVHGFGQNRRAWHLSQRSFANALAAAGHPVFNVDLRGHGEARGGEPQASWLEYARDDLPAVLVHATAATGCDRAVVFGHSLGGLIATVTAGASPSVRALGLFAVPRAFGVGNTSLEVLASALGVVAARAPRGAFPMQLVRGIFERTEALWESRWMPLPIRAWHPGGFEVGLLREWLSASFDRASLGEIAGLLATRVDASEVTAALSLFDARRDLPLWVVAGRHDLLAPPRSARVAFTQSQSEDKTFSLVDHGHGDLLVGTLAPAQVWRPTLRWLERVG